MRPFKHLERSFYQNKIKPWLDSLDNCWYFRLELGVFGMPDIIGCYHGRFFALELKRSELELSKPRTKLQGIILGRIRNAGGFGEFIYPENLEDMKALLISFCP